jgi:uncharacterized integral membrane protein
VPLACHCRAPAVSSEGRGGCIPVARAASVLPGVRRWHIVVCMGKLLLVLLAVFAVFLVVSVLISALHFLFIVALVAVVVVGALRLTSCVRRRRVRR